MESIQGDLASSGHINHLRHAVLVGHLSDLEEALTPELRIVGYLMAWMWITWAEVPYGFGNTIILSVLCVAIVISVEYGFGSWRKL